MTTPLIEAIARALCEQHIREVRQWDTDPRKLKRMLPEAVDYSWTDFVDRSTTALTAINEAGYAIVPREPPAGAYQAMLPAVMAGAASDIYRAMINSAQAIEARSGETEGLDPQGESAARQGAPDHIMPPPVLDAGPLESEEGE